MGLPSLSSTVVRSLWIGNRLTTLQQLSIRSFLSEGHDFVLYVYENVEGIPAGTIVQDGRKVLPEDRIFFYADGFGRGSPAGFSNAFRYRLLFEQGGWWVDLDTVCLKSFQDLSGEYVFGFQRTPHETRKVASSVIKVPRGSELMERCCAAVESVDPKTIRWGQTGPDLVDAKVRELHLESAILDPAVFYEINHWEFRQFLGERQLPNASYATHLWAAKWAAETVDPDAAYPPDCLYERLKRKYLPERYG
jgi:hypothetical protein